MKDRVYYRENSGVIFCGDCVEVMKAFPSGKVDLTVTSSPYDNLRDYKGYDFDFAKIANELYRVAKDGGVVVWVVGDATVKGSETGSSFRQALYFKDIGFNLHDTMIYAKSGFAKPANNRYHQTFEYMFVLSRGSPKVVNLLKDKINKQSGKIKKGQWLRQKDGEVNFNPNVELILDDFGRRYNIWQYETGYQKSTNDRIAYNHSAIFPEVLAEDHILSWSNEGDLILDPMCGSGTTCKMAKLNRRKFIGIDISEEYCKITKERLISVVGEEG